MFNTTCQKCGGKITFNQDKLTTIVGGGIAVTALAAAFGLAGGGWLALGTAALGGSKAAEMLLRAKIALAKESHRLGGVFKCSKCKRDIPVAEVLNLSERESPNYFTNVNVYPDGEYILGIDYEFIVSNQQNKELQVRSYLYYDNNTPVLCTDENLVQYISVDGQVCVTTDTFSPVEAMSTYSGTMNLPVQTLPSGWIKRTRNYILETSLYVQEGNEHLFSERISFKKKS